MFQDGYGLISFDMSRSADPSIPDMPRANDLQLHIDYRNALDIATTFILIMVCFRKFKFLKWRQFFAFRFRSTTRSFT